MRKRTARMLRKAADRLDPKPKRWYASAWQQSSSMNINSFTTTGMTATNTGPGSSWRAQPKPRRRVLADYLTTRDLKKLRP